MAEYDSSDTDFDDTSSYDDTTADDASSADDSASYDDSAETSDTDSESASTNVEFPDGTTQTDPYTDAQGQVYETHDDYIDGTEPHEITDTEGDTSTATPSE
jgi:hypothetical protein